MTMSVRWKSFRGPMVSAAVQTAARHAVGTGAELILEDANRTVPIEEGTLGRSGAVSVDGSAPRATVSYDTPYARRQHEDTRLRHDAGRRAKWLQLTFDEKVEVVRALIAAEIKAVMS